MTIVISTHFKKTVERVFWTGAEVGIGLVSLTALNAWVGTSLGPTYVVLVAPVLAYVKALVAKHVGDPNSPSIKLSDIFPRLARGTGEASEAAVAASVAPTPPATPPTT